MKLLRISLMFMLLATTTILVPMEQEPEGLGALSSLNTPQKEYMLTIFSYHDVQDTGNTRLVNRTLYEIVKTVWEDSLRKGHIGRYSPQGQRLLFYYLLMGEIVADGVLDSLREESEAFSWAFSKMCGKSGLLKVVCAHHEYKHLISSETVDRAFEEAAYQNNYLALFALSESCPRLVTKKGANGALRWATFHNNTDMFERIFKNFDHLLTSRGIASACCSGISCNNLPLIIKLVQRFKRKFKQQIMEHVFLWAARNNHLKIVKSLVNIYCFNDRFIMSAIEQMMGKKSTQETLKFLRSLLA